MGGLADAALVGFTIASRDSIAVYVLGFRLGRRPEISLDLLSSPDGSAGGRALRKFVQTEKGREFLLRKYLDEQLSARKRARVLKVSGTNDWALFWFDENWARNG